MPDLSLPTANLLSNTGNAALILGAFLVLAGTWLAIWASGEKERYSDERIATNETKTATANAEAAKAIRETEVLRNDNLALSIKLEQEHSARLKIESGLASRRVSGNRRELLVEALRHLNPKPNVCLERIVGDAETRAFGEELTSALSEGGIQFLDNTSLMAPGLPEGLTIIGNGSPEADRLIGAFRAAGISLSMQNGQPQSGCIATVFVGLKPPSF
jgi:hypothetical protein